MSAQPSLKSPRFLPGEEEPHSLKLGWGSLTLRSTINPPEFEDLTLPATPDHHIVLVTAGTCAIESHRQGRWQRVHYRPGDLGMTAPGQETRLQWKSAQSHHTLHLHLPSELLQTVRESLGVGASTLEELPNLLRQTDPLVAAVMTALERAAQTGAPELYAESAAHFLAAHLLTSSAPSRVPPLPKSSRLRSADAALERVEDFMRAHLEAPITLEQLARVAGLNAFQLLRTTKARWQETPMRRLTRLRMELAQSLLEQDGFPISEVAFRCGYGNPSHFAAAFRRVVGVTPSHYQRLH